ncbi:hypothetical protein HG530_005746 [Fusarium avenaceum]|nr:hypothetical protein HG530_005746 [Fusarium avenaceum]
MHLMYTLDAQGNRLYTLKKVAQGQVTKSAHPARFSPDDKWSRQRVTLKRRFELLLTQQRINLRDQNYRTTEKDSTDGVTNQSRSPIVLSASVLGKTPVGRAVNRLGHTVDIAASVPLEVLLEMQFEVAVLVSRAAGAAVTPKDPVLEMRDAREGGSDEVEVHSECDVLHGVIGGCDPAAFVIGGFLLGGFFNSFNCLVGLFARCLGVFSVCSWGIGFGSLWGCGRLDCALGCLLGLWLFSSLVGLRRLLDRVLDGQVIDSLLQRLLSLLSLLNLLGFLSLLRFSRFVWLSVDTLLARSFPQSPVTTISFALQFIPQSQNVNIRLAENSQISCSSRKVPNNLYACGAGRSKGDEWEKSRLYSRSSGGISDFGNDRREGVEYFGFRAEGVGGRVVLDERASVKDKAVDRLVSRCV